jgi:hypothetical protein
MTSWIRISHASWAMELKLLEHLQCNGWCSFPYSQFMDYDQPQHSG